WVRVRGWRWTFAGGARRCRWSSHRSSPRRRLADLAHGRRGGDRPQRAGLRQRERGADQRQGGQGGGPFSEVQPQVQQGLQRQHLAGAYRRGVLAVVWQQAPVPDGGGEVAGGERGSRSEEHTSELQSRENLVCRLLLEKK